MDTMPSHARMGPTLGSAGWATVRLPEVEAGATVGGRGIEPELSPPLSMLATETEVAC